MKSLGALRSSLKSPYRESFIHTFIHMCTFWSFLLQIWGKHFSKAHKGASQIHHTERASCTLTYTYMHILVFFPIQGDLQIAPRCLNGLCETPIQRCLHTDTYIHTYAHLGLFLQIRSIHEIPIGNLAKPRYRGVS